MANREVKRLLEQAGVNPTSEDLDALQSFYEKYKPRLETLRNADLGKEEVAGTFDPRQPRTE